MTYTVELLPVERTLLTTFDEDFRLAQHGTALLEEMKAEFDKASAPLVMLDDLTHLHMGFSDLVSALAISTRGASAITRHPNVSKVVFVSTNNLFAICGEALKQVQYGQVKVEIYRTLDEALAAIRQSS